MIVPENKPKKVSAQQALEDSSIRFYLTGSRFFGTQHQFSDTDYFTENTPMTEAFLLAHGFQRVTSSAYLDTNTVKVLTCLGTNPSDRIDVQLVKSVEKKAKAQAALKSAKQLYPTTEMWNAMWAALA